MLQCKSSTEKEVFALTKQIFSFMTVLALAAVMLLPCAGAEDTGTTFDDISGLPCEASVNKLYEAGVVAGTTTHTFDPEGGADPGADGHHPGPGLRSGGNR